MRKSDLAREAANARDLELINRAADELNAEAADALEYQATDLIDWDLELPEGRKP